VTTRKANEKPVLQFRFAVGVSVFQYVSKSEKSSRFAPDLSLSYHRFSEIPGGKAATETPNHRITFPVQFLSASPGLVEIFVAPLDATGIP
jgi:hypothetical protein